MLHYTPSFFGSLNLFLNLDLDLCLILTRPLTEKLNNTDRRSLHRSNDRLLLCVCFYCLPKVFLVLNQQVEFNQHPQHQQMDQ